MPTPPSRILDLCGSWICCSRFFPGGCPRIGTLDSRRFLSIPVDSSPLGLGTRVTRRAVASTSGAACTRGSVRAHSRARGITLRNVPKRNPTCQFQCIQILWNSKPPVERAIHPLPQGTRDLLQYFPRRQLSRDNAKTGHSVRCG